MVTRCDLCGAKLETTQLSSCRYVEGWEKNRNSGGTNAIHLRKTHDRWAHWTCVQLAQKGRLGQEELL